MEKGYPPRKVAKIRTNFWESRNPRCRKSQRGREVLDELSAVRWPAIHGDRSLPERQEDPAPSRVRVMQVSVDHRGGSSQWARRYRPSRLTGYGLIVSLLAVSTCAVGEAVSAKVNALLEDWGLWARGGSGLGYRSSGLGRTLSAHGQASVQADTESLLGVDRAVAALPDGERKLLRGYYLGGADNAALAERLGISTRTLRRRLAKAKAAIAHRLAGDPGSRGATAGPNLAGFG